MITQRMRVGVDAIPEGVVAVAIAASSPLDQVLVNKTLVGVGEVVQVQEGDALHASPSRPWLAWPWVDSNSGVDFVDLHLFVAADPRSAAPRRAALRVEQEVTVTGSYDPGVLAPAAGRRLCRVGLWIPGGGPTVDLVVLGWTYARSSVSTPPGLPVRRCFELAYINSWAPNTAHTGDDEGLHVDVLEATSSVPLPVAVDEVDVRVVERVSGSTAQAWLWVELE